MIKSRLGTKNQLKNIDFIKDFDILCPICIYFNDFIPILLYFLIIFVKLYGSIRQQAPSSFSTPTK